MKRFVDTNIFIHSLFPIDKKKFEKCVYLFNHASGGKIQLWTTEWVISELIWFLRRKKISVLQCKEITFKILATRGLEVRNKSWILEVLDIWQSPLSFTDTIHIVSIKQGGVKAGYSYDKDFDGFAWFNRLEP